MRSTLFVLLCVAGCWRESGNKLLDAGNRGGLDARFHAGPAPLNGCRPQQAVDASAQGANRTITFDDSDTYTPKCLRIAAGQSVTWSGSFGDHPLRAGIV